MAPNEMALHIISKYLGNHYNARLAVKFVINEIQDYANESNVMYWNQVMNEIDKHWQISLMMHN